MIYYNWLIIVVGDIMEGLILSNKNKLRISTIMLSTIILSCIFMIFNDQK